jgi:hypothetical protein
VCWCRTVIQALGEAEAGGLQVQGYLGLHRERPYYKKKKKKKKRLARTVITSTVLQMTSVTKVGGL